MEDNNHIQKYSMKMQKRIIEVLPTIILSVGCSVLPMFFEMSTWTTESKIISVCSSLLTICIIVIGYYHIADIINSRITRNNILRLPKGVKKEDICPYVIEEEVTKKEYTFSKTDNSKFDILSSNTYKITGAAEETHYINHIFNGLADLTQDDITFKIEHLDGVDIIESYNPLKKNGLWSIKINFRNPLSKGDMSSYRISLRYNNYQQSYISSIDSFPNFMVRHIKRGKREKNKIVLLLKFPKDYKISKPNFLVKTLSNKDVKSVLDNCYKENRSLKKQLKQNPIILKLVVKDPISELDYGIEWLPNVKNKKI